jgi:plasmid stabilization system protein ParE
MVVEWTSKAEDRLRGIFNYYLDAAGQNTAKKIVFEIRDLAESLRLMPLMAPIEPLLADEAKAFRSLVINRRYKAIYFIERETVNIVDIWDCRQSPEKLSESVKTQ